MSRINYIESMMPGFHVEQKTGGLVSVVNNGLNLCIDDRKVEGWTTGHIKRGPKTLGASVGTAFLAAESSGRRTLDKGYLDEFFGRVWGANATPAAHDIKPMHCKHAGLVLAGSFGGSVDVKLTDQDVLDSLKQAKGSHVRLSGNHNPSSPLRVNFKDGTTLEQNGYGYTLDYWWTVGWLGISDRIIMNNLSTTARALGISTIQVYE